MPRKLRLFGKQRPRMKTPSLAKAKQSDKGFSLRAIEELDNRYHCVKQMRLRLSKLLDDCDADTQQKEWLCGRAVALLAFIESMEVKLAQGKPFKETTYLQATRVLADLLGKLGLDKASKTAKTLESYLIDQRHRKKKA